MAEGRFAGQVVLITGAAGGFGRLAAQRFAAEGALLALSDIDAEGLATTARGIGPEVFAETVDASDEAGVSGHVAAVLERFGRLDVAINNAGAAHPLTPLPDIAAAEFDRMIAINARSVFLGLKYQLPPMLATGRGAILNVSSAAGLVGAGHLAAYAAAKHAVIGLTRAAADEAARKGVRVNALCPSFAATPLFDGIADAFAAQRGTDRAAAYERISARVPMARVADPEEVVQAMLWICAPENGFMTGQAIAVDGGLTAV